MWIVSSSDGFLLEVIRLPAQNKINSAETIRWFLGGARKIYTSHINSTECSSASYSDLVSDWIRLGFLSRMSKFDQPGYRFFWGSESIFWISMPDPRKSKKWQFRPWPKKWLFLGFHDLVRNFQKSAIPDIVKFLMVSTWFRPNRVRIPFPTRLVKTQKNVKKTSFFMGGNLNCVMISGGRIRMHRLDGLATTLQDQLEPFFWWFRELLGWRNSPN